MGSRMDRERRTIEVMIAMYCGDLHGGRDGPCDRCTELRDHALSRLDRCRFGDHKPTCANCPVHCYRPEMRERVREVMRHSGPRMLLRHPLMAIAHIRDGRRRPPE